MESIPAWLGFIGFLPLWAAAISLISRLSGWARLAERYEAPDNPSSETFRMQSIRMGAGRYNGCLTIGLSRQGMHLATWPLFRPGHKPLLIPWDKISAPELRKFFLFTSYVVVVDSVRIELSPKVIEAARPYAPWPPTNQV